MFVVCSPGYRPFLQAVQGHTALLQQYLSTTPPHQPAQRHPSLPKCNVGSLADGVSNATTVLQSADNVSNASASRENRIDSEEEEEYPSDTEMTVKPDNDSRCVIS